MKRNKAYTVVNPLVIKDRKDTSPDFIDIRLTEDPFKDWILTIHKINIADDGQAGFETVIQGIPKNISDAYLNTCMPALNDTLTGVFYDILETSLERGYDEIRNSNSEKSTV